MLTLAAVVLFAASTALAQEPEPLEPAPAATPALVASKMEPPPGRIAGKLALANSDAEHGADQAVVYIERVDPALWTPGEKARRTKGAAAPRLTMEHKRFAPHVLVALQGVDVDFPNLDPVFHNVFSISGKNKFDLGLYKDGKSKTRDFKEPGLVRLYCNIHPSMSAFILVVQNPWYIAPDADGSFRLKGLKAGKYTLRVWHERGGEATQEVEVKAGKLTSANFQLDAAEYKELPHKNKMGQDYSAVPPY